MIVFVVLRSDSYDRAEILGVRFTKEGGMRLAEEFEPERKFEWIHDNDDNAHVHPFQKDAPIYSYYVERQDVQ